MSYWSRESEAEVFSHPDWEGIFSQAPGPDWELGRFQSVFNPGKLPFKPLDESRYVKMTKTEEPWLIWRSCLLGLPLLAVLQLGRPHGPLGNPGVLWLGVPPCAHPTPQAPSTHPSSGPWTIPAHHRGTAPARWTGPPWILPGTPAVSASHRRSVSREAGRGEGVASLLGQGPRAQTLDTPSPSPAQGWSPESFQS